MTGRITLEWEFFKYGTVLTKPYLKYSHSRVTRPVLGSVSVQQRDVLYHLCIPDAWSDTEERLFAGQSTLALKPLDDIRRVHMVFVSVRYLPLYMPRIMVLSKGLSARVL